MTFGRHSWLGCLIVVGLLAEIGRVHAAPPQADRATVSGAVLNRVAIRKVWPEFPPSSLRAKTQGVVVARLYVSAAGLAEKVEVLQAPSDDIAAAVQQALGRWILPIIRRPDGKPTSAKAKLFFYFVVQDGRGLVLTAEQFAAGRVPPGKPPTKDDSEVRVIDAVAWKRMVARGDAVLVDIRDRAEFSRGHLPEAVNIPDDELESRVWEIATSRTVVLDCPRELEPLCRHAVVHLQQAGVLNFSLLGRH